MTAAAVAPDGKDIESRIASQLDYLSRLARHLGIADPVEEYFAPVVGRWSDMHAEADRWRLVGGGVEQVTDALNKPLGKLDAAWDGEAAESFIAYMQRVGLAGNDLADAMTAMADVLDKTADSIREIVMELATVMSETAATVSGAMTLPVQGDARAREYLDLMQRPTKELFEAVRQILEGFVQLCEGAEGEDTFGRVTMAHTYPSENWSVPVPPSVPAPDTGTPPPDVSTESADAGAGLGAGGGFGTGAGGGGAGLGAAAASASPLTSGNYTVAGEQAPTSSAPAPAAAAAASGPGTSRSGGMPMMPMGAMGAGQGQGGDHDHKSRSRVVGNPQDIFGKPEKASTPVIGGDD
ncbi:WXG100 family type VII secretion target [Actinophytocola oryzae]|uniref:Type VII secretion system (Wss) protein ESAT-6 n=1 Tax=Actinophytocola oryzae TaxID=502181 RepID=A0A4V3FQB6_9PSEU|nr:WXG100 family type VII secretion target [Actinophytocola oryzae]TDV37620.1 type VII secretion system (Wss) protein ESAT-6 [Actinophytocola oryzae]